MHKRPYSVSESLVSSRAVAMVGVSLLVAVLSACERRGVEEQTVPKGSEEVPEAQSEAPVSEPQPEAQAEPHTHPWTIPDGWEEDPEPRRMRLATYVVPDSSGRVEVAMSRFPGRVGGILANMNRWRGQMGLSPITDAELDEAIERFSSPGFEGYQTRIEGASGVMLAAGVYEASIDQTWFVRATVAEISIADRIEADLFGVARSIAGIEGEDDG